MGKFTGAQWYDAKWGECSACGRWSRLLEDMCPLCHDDDQHVDEVADLRAQLAAATKEKEEAERDAKVLADVVLAAHADDRFNCGSVLGNEIYWCPACTLARKVLGR